MAAGRTHHPSRGLVALVLVLALAAAACGGGGDDEGGSGGSGGESPAATITVPARDTDEPQYGGTLVYGLAAETNGWDPTTSQWGPWGLTVARTFFDTLTIFDDQGEIHPYLAESFEPNDDFTSWVITLRPGVTFHNGEELTAAVLKANWDAYAESPLVGRIFDQIESTEVIGDPETSLQMRANTTAKWVNFPEAWTTQIGVVQAMESLEADSATRAQHPIGTGPFVFDEWVQDSHLRVVRNEDYWQEGLPYLDSVEFRPIPDPTSRSAALRSGEVDIAELEEIQPLEQVREDENLVVWQDPTAETAESFVMFNTQSPPLDDPDLRRALVMATDRVTINEALNEGQRQLADGPFRPSSPWYVETDYPDFDLAAAQQLVSEYEAEHGDVEITLEVGVGGAIGSETAQLIQSQWQAAGVDVTLGSTEVAQLIANVVTGNYQAVVWRQFDSPSPLQESVWWHEDGAPPPPEVGLNFARNVDPVLSDALDQFRQVEGREAEQEQIAIVQQQLAADLPYAFITHIDAAVVASPDVKNVFYAPIPDSDATMMPLHNSAHALLQVWIDQAS